MPAQTRKQGFLDWAKSKTTRDVLSHSSVAEPTVQDAVNAAYCSPAFKEELAIDNQWGHLHLKSQIAARYSVEDTDKAPRVLLTPGASSAIYLVCKTFLQPGDEVIIEAPTYEPLLDAAVSVGAHPVLWPREETTFALDLDALNHLVTGKTRLILLSNPHNPSGAYASTTQLQELDRLVSGSPFGVHIKVVVDEIYLDMMRLTGEPRSVSADDVKPNGGSAVLAGDRFISVNRIHFKSRDSALSETQFIF